MKRDTQNTSIIADAADYRRTVKRLCKNEPVFYEVVQQWGIPPMWFRPPGFVSLLHIILEQQVSLASAQAVMDKLRARTTRLTPSSFLAFSDKQLKQMGFSHQKTSYAQGLARAIKDNSLPLTSINQLPEDGAYAELVRLRGIGPWTANIYLMMALRRTDIWPSGDLALRIAMRELFEPAISQYSKRNNNHIGEDDIQLGFSERWKPYRSVAVRICWLHYLRIRNR